MFLIRSFFADSQNTPDPLSNFSSLHLPVNCGNILETKLADIWQNNQNLAKMREVGSLEGKCGVCGYRELCGGCRGRAFGATGNYMAEEPFCAYIPPQAVTES